MARDGSGVYSYPAGTLAETLTTISSSDYNAYVEDVTADLNLARPVSAGGTGATNATAARSALGAAASGVNTDITSITTDSSGLRTKCMVNANTMAVINSSTLTASRYINFVTGDADRAITQYGNLTIGGDTYIGWKTDYSFPGYQVIMRCSAATDVILPTSGTLATLAGAETLSNKSLIVPVVDYLTITHGVPTISFNETGFGTRWIHCDAGYFLFRMTSGADGFQMFNNGDASCSGAFVAGTTVNAGTAVGAATSLHAGTSLHVGTTGSFGGAVTASSFVAGTLMGIAGAVPAIWFTEDGVGASRIFRQDGAVFQWTNAGASTNDMELTSGGGLTVLSTIAAPVITQTSDARLKKDVSTIDDALDLVKRMRGVRFTRIADETQGVGVIAQEMQGVLPEVVREKPDDEEKTLSVAYGNLVGVLIEAIKTLEARVAALEA